MGKISSKKTGSQPGGMGVTKGVALVQAVVVKWIFVNCGYILAPRTSGDGDIFVSNQCVIRPGWFVSGLIYELLP